MQHTAVLLLSGAVVFASIRAPAQDQSKALDEISRFADHVCQTVPVKSSSEKLNLSGPANADLKRLLSTVADLGGKGAVEYKKVESEGVLQKDLAALLQHSTDCKQQISNKLIDKLIILRDQPAANDENISLDGRILLECTDAALPSTIPVNGSLYFLSLHPAAAQSQLGRFSLPPGAPVNWGIKSVGAYKCEIKNYGNSVIAHVVIPFKVIFRKSEKADHGGHSGDFEKEQDLIISIPALRANALDAFEFYIYNSSNLYATVQIPTEASVLVLGEKDKRTVKLMHPTFYRGLTLFPVELQTETETPQLPAAAQPPPDSVPARLDKNAIAWDDNRLLILMTGGGPGALITSVLLQGESTRPVGFKTAYAVSGRTGHRQELMANVQSEGRYYPVSKVDIPAKAPVWLELLFNPSLSINDFLDQWGSFSITMLYQDGTIYEHEFDENFIRDKLRSLMPSAFGPRVTPKSDK